MTNQPKIPYEVNEWKAIYREASSHSVAADSYESLILNIIFGERYIKDTVDLLANNFDLQESNLVEPIEKFLRAVSSPMLRQYLLELCFGSKIHNVVLTACFLLPSVAAVDLWPHLPAFAASSDPDLWRCGASIGRNLADFVTTAEIKAAADLFRAIEDPHVAAKVKELDAMAAESNDDQTADPQIRNES